MATSAPLAADKLRERGGTHLVERPEIGMPAAWLNLGELDCAEARLDELIARGRRSPRPVRQLEF
jgi:hypothetical protein